MYFTGTTTTFFGCFTVIVMSPMDTRSAPPSAWLEHRRMVRRQSLLSGPFFKMFLRTFEKVRNWLKNKSIIKRIRNVFQVSFHLFLQNMLSLFNPLSSLFNPLSSFIQMYQNRRQKQDNGIFHNLVYVSIKYLGTVMYP